MLRTAASVCARVRAGFGGGVRKASGKATTQEECVKVRMFIGHVDRLDAALLRINQLEDRIEKMEAQQAAAAAAGPNDEPEEVTSASGRAFNVLHK